MILDAAALLCVLLDEPGADMVVPHLRGASMSAVNVSECCSRGAERELALGIIVDSIRRFELVVHAFDGDSAIQAAELRPLTRHAGVSLGDRACLALAQRLRLPILTGDRRMGSLADTLGLDIRLIR